MKILVAIAMIAVTALRAWNLDAASIWADEQDSLMQSRVWNDIWANRGNGALYFALLHAWRAMFGDSELALRSLSVLLGTLVVALAGWLAYRISRDKFAAPLGIAVAGVMPILVWHARDARMYPLWAVAALLGLHSLLSFAQQGPKRRIVAEYWFANVVGLLTHSFHVFYILGLFCAALAARRSRRDYFLLHAPVIATCLVFFIRLQLLAGNTFHYVMQHAYTQWDFRFFNSLGEVFFYLNPAQSRRGEVPTGLVAFFVLGVATLVPWTKGNRGKSSAVGWRMVSVALWIPFLVQHLLPVRDYARLFTPMAAMASVILGAFLSRLCAYVRNNTVSPRYRQAGVSVVVAIPLLVLGWRLPRVLTTDMEPWKQVCKSIHQHGPQTGERWIVSEVGQPESPLEHCEHLRGKYLLHSPESKSFLAPIEGGRIVVFRSPPWVKDDESYLRYYPPSEYQLTFESWGPYLEATYIDELPKVQKPAPRDVSSRQK